MSFLRRQDWLLNLTILLLAIFSLTILSSVSLKLFWQQLAWFIFGFFLIFSLAAINIRPLLNYRWFILGIYIFAALLLVITYFLAPEIRGSKGWLVIGPFHYQTSEFAKLALIILLAYYFSKRHIGIAHIGNLLKSFSYFLILAVLILIQPDFGAMIVLFGIWAGFLLVSGIRWRHLIAGFLIILTILFLSWNYFLKDYQRERIIGFFSPAYDPLGINYSVIQSKIAIGSAGFFGKGFGQGAQTQLGFLPEAPTDFIFSAFVEEWGFLGGAILLLTFLFLIFRLIKIGLNQEDNFSKFICLGTVILFLFQFSLNIGSVLSLLPVVGVTFPLFSYGGSSLLTVFLLIAIIQNIVSRSKF
jgi:rod shape determining protein RodA